jgi:hypothetical protein
LPYTGPYSLQAPFHRLEPIIGRTSTIIATVKPLAILNYVGNMGIKTFSQTMMRFQNPTIESSISDAPCHIRVSLLATRYMKCRMNSIVNRQKTKRRRYDIV